MNFNWRVAIIAFVITSVTVIFGAKFDVFNLVFAGPLIGGLIAGYMVEDYLEGILNGAFPVCLSATALLVSSLSWNNYTPGYSLGIESSELYPVILVVGLFSMLFLFSLIGPITGVTMKKIRNDSLKYHNNSYNAVMDANVTDSTYTEKEVSKSKNNNIWETIFIYITILFIIMGIAWICYMFFAPVY